MNELEKVSLWEVGDICTVAAVSQQEAIQTAIDEHMIEQDEVGEVEAELLDDASLDKIKRREDETGSTDPTFRQALESDIKSGRKVPFLFAVSASVF